MANEKIPLQDSFEICLNVDKESLIVFYNDVEQNELEISYDEATGKIKLSPEPSENSTVQIKFTLK